MSAALPSSVRYIKNGPGGRWWKTAKERGQIHCGWRGVPAALLEAGDLAAIEPIIRSEFGVKRGATQDFNALRTLIDRPSRHVWVTFEDGRMWWCTVHDGVDANPDGDETLKGHFWLTCASAWSDQSITGHRRLTMSELPGFVTALAGYRATVCEPRSSPEILRIIQNEEDRDVVEAARARLAFEIAMMKLVARLRPKDFEVLVDLIFSRSGWTRLDRVGSVTEGIDIEVENVVSGEIAFVQVKSAATQATLDRYISLFHNRRDRYQHMIFAVHSPSGALTAGDHERVQVWSGNRIAELVVKYGLGDWVAARL